jgi:hypothetical protein
MHPSWRVCDKNLNIVSMCAVSPVVHTSNISSCQKNFFCFPVVVNNSIKEAPLVLLLQMFVITENNITSCIYFFILSLIQRCCQSVTQAMKRRMSGWWRIIGTGERVTEGHRFRIYGRRVTLALSWREWRKPWTPIRNGQCFDQESNYPHFQIQARHVTASVNLLVFSELKLRPFSSFR